MDRLLTRRLEPGEGGDVHLAEAHELQDRRRQIHPTYLRLAALRPPAVLRRAPETQANPWANSPRPTSPLLRRGARNRRQLQAIEADSRVKAENPCQTVASRLRQPEPVSLGAERSYR